MSPAAKGRVLLYEDVTLYEEDVSTLDRHRWLTDNMVSFAASYLYNSVLAKELRSEVHIVYASLTELIKNTPPAGASRLYSEMGLSPKKWLLFILSDNQRPGVAYAGAHWSLVMFAPLPHRRFLLFDSLQSSAYVDWRTRKFAERLHHFLLVDAREPGAAIIEAYEHCPQMGYTGDCGVFVIEYIHAILKAINANPLEPSFCLSHITDAYVERSRQEWKKLIGRLSTTLSK